ncbi:MAG: M20/M25/M40 family metallo-hydrolase [Chloroflexia bacterium]|nr:M20/M25/M40 family metallo-hydrolase [Chloroflexia bacterium]
MKGTTSMQNLKDAAAKHLDTVTERTMRICEVPSPTGLEHHRAQFVASLFQELGYEPEIDDINNVYVRRGNKGGKAVMLLAHIDTVFPAGTEITVRRDDEWLYGPGIGDNASNVASMITTLQILDELGIETDSDIIAVANVGEEGLGNLRGARQAVERFQDELGAVVVLDGRIGRVTTSAVGSVRWRVTVNGPGGHSYGAFGLPSAIHGLCRIGAAIADLKVPEQPKTTFNVGVIEGGTTVNSIAASANAIVDMRSESAQELEKLVAQVRDIVDTRAGEGLETEIELLGERPAGQQQETDPLIVKAAEGLRWVGYDPTFEASSTDMNIPISFGIPAVCVGVSEGERGHTVHESIRIAPFEQGLALAVRLSIDATDWVAKG